MDKDSLKRRTPSSGNPDPATEVVKSPLARKPSKTPGVKKTAASSRKKRAPGNNDGIIVGIGASAGGLEALQEFFRAMPADSGMVFVIVQHLDPTHSSSLSDILSHCTSMPVTEAADGMEVVPNSVYVNSPAFNMGIHGGRLTLEDPEQRQGLRLPINFFFSSLAREAGPNAVCIILSGTGSDGTEGLKAVKLEQGLVLAQDPDSAKYNGMPNSAISTGLVDAILPLPSLASALIQMVSHISIPARQSLTTDDMTAPLQQIFALILARTGHDFSHYRQTTIHRRLQRRMGLNKIRTFPRYSDFLKNNPAEIQALVKDILISVTSFFRDPEAFNSLKQRLMKIVKSKTPDEKIRVWVTGCATGEEAYSVLMIIAECMDETGKRLTVQMFATDIDESALNIARAGIYPVGIETAVSQARLTKFFTKSGQNYRIQKTIRDMVVFSTHNFIKDPPFSRMDLICCRNLLIYLDTQTQQRQFPAVHFALNPGGLLFLGSSETIGKMSDLFDPHDRKWKIYHRREVTPDITRSLRFAARTGHASKPASGREVAPPEKLSEVLEQIFFDNYSPTFVVIDDKYQVIYVRGRTSKYLGVASGKANQSILAMAREGLKTDLSAAIYEAHSKETQVIRRGLRMKIDGEVFKLNLRVVPLSHGLVPSGYLMVVFQTEEGLSGESKSGRSGTLASRHTQELETEIQTLQENIHSISGKYEVANEELTSANEELQSNNEELQSTNEELDTAQEELQSTNQELLTLNTELESNNERLSTANEKLDVLNKSLEEAVRDAEISARQLRAFYSLSELTERKNITIEELYHELANILPASWQYPEVACARIVMGQDEYHSGNFKSCEWKQSAPVTVNELVVGKIEVGYLEARPAQDIGPFLEEEQILIEDVAARLGRITARTIAGQELLKSEQRHRSILQTAMDGIWRVDMQGRLIEVNESYCRMSGYDEQELLAMSISDLENNESDDAIAGHINRVIEHGQERFETSHRRKDGRVIDVEVSVQYRAEYGGSFTVFLHDISERKKSERFLEMGRKILGILNRTEDLHSSISEILRTFKDTTGFDAVGIRLQEGDDFPYYAQEGFSGYHLLTENSLVERDMHGDICRDQDGNVMLECTCGLVVSGKTDTNNPSFTPGGSFWTNDFFPMLNLSSEDDPRHNPRNKCIHQGYASVALIPIRAGTKIVGLIHLNDRRKGLLDINSIQIIEGIASQIGTTILRKQAEDTFRNVSVNSPAGIYIVQKGKFVYTNPQFQKATGYSEGELLGMISLDLVSPEDREIVRQNAVRILKEKGTTPYEYRIVTKQGETRWSSETLASILYRGERAALGSYQDITERKQAEQTLQLQADLLDAESNSVDLHDFEGNILYCNKAFCVTLGYTKEEMTGMKLFQVDDQDAVNAVQERHKALLEKGKISFTVNHRRKNGSYVPMDVDASLIEIGGRKLVISVARDITERKQLQEKLMAQDRLVSIGQLVSGVAHEINNPLTGVIGFSDLLLARKDLPDDANADIKIINAEAKRSAMIVKNLLTFSRQNAENKVLFDIQTCIDRVFALRSHEQAINNITVNTHFTPELPLVEGDIAQLQQVFLNLVINAEQAILDANHHGTLTAVTERAGDNVRITIADDGQGIRPENMKKLFTPFFTTKDIGKGTGLGLSISHGIVTAHGGKIYAESEFGKGATFIVEIPIAKKQANG